MWRHSGGTQSRSSRHDAHRDQAREFPTGEGYGTGAKNLTEVYSTSITPITWAHRLCHRRHRRGLPAPGILPLRRNLGRRSLRRYPRAIQVHRAGVRRGDQALLLRRAVLRSEDQRLAEPRTRFGDIPKRGQSPGCAAKLANGWHTNLRWRWHGRHVRPEKPQRFRVRPSKSCTIYRSDGRCPDGCVITVPAAAVIATVGAIVIGGVYILSSEERQHQIAWAFNSGWESLKSMAQSGGKPAEKAQQNAVSQSGPVAAAGAPNPNDDENKNQNEKETRPTDRYKENLDQRTLDAARRELRGETVRLKSGGDAYDHITKVREAQRGLLNRIEAITKRLGSPSQNTPENRD